MSDNTGLTEEERRNLQESMDRHRGALEMLAGDHTCDLRKRGCHALFRNAGHHRGAGVK